MISRANLATQAEKMFGPTVTALEAIIDDELVEHVRRFGMHGSLTQNLVANRQVINELVNRYQQNGYKVKFISDQRDGDFIQIWLD